MRHHPLNSGIINAKHGNTIRETLKTVICDEVQIVDFLLSHVEYKEKYIWRKNEVLFHRKNTLSVCVRT